MSGVRILHFLKDWWKFIQIHQYYTMALISNECRCPSFHYHYSLWPIWALSVHDEVCSFLTVDLGVVEWTISIITGVVTSDPAEAPSDVTRLAERVWGHPTVSIYEAKKKKNLCCPHPTKIWKLGRSVDFFFFFFFFTYRERVEFSNIFFKFLNGENSGGMQSKRIYTSAFLGHWIQILANSSPKSDIFNNKKQKTTLFFRILRSVGRGQHNNFFFLPDVIPTCFLLRKSGFLTAIKVDKIT